MDKRVKRTHQLLGNALIELLQEEPFHKIHIRCITDRADVAYSTFFRNFDCIEELLSDYLSTFLDDLRTQTYAIHENSFRLQSLKMIQTIFEHVQQHPTMHRTLFQTPAACPVLTQFKEDLAEHHLSLLQNYEEFMHRHNTSPPLNLVAYSAVTQLFGMIEWWINNDFQPSPYEMTRHHEKLVTIPMWHLVLGRDTASGTAEFAR